MRLRPCSISGSTDGSFSSIPISMRTARSELRVSHSSRRSTWLRIMLSVCMVACAVLASPQKSGEAASASSPAIRLFSRSGSKMPPCFDDSVAELLQLGPAFLKRHVGSPGF
ncbi:hypothetical protein D3C72_2196010 [compost metagenome]